jgi:hypothetical protein
MTQELTIRRNGGPISTWEPEEEEGSLGLAPSDMRPPWIRFNGQSGELLSTFDGSLETVRRVVLLRKLPDTRVYFNPDLDAPQKVLCRSSDMLRPVDVEQARAINAGGPQHDSCLACPFAEFGKDASGKVTKAPCGKALNLAAATVPQSEDELPVPALMSFRSTAIKPVAAALSQLEILHRTTKRPAFAWVVELAPGARVRDGAKSYFPLTVKVLPERVPEELLPAYGALWTLMRDLTVDMSVEAENVADPAADTAPDESGVTVMSAEELGSLMDTQEAAAAEKPRESLFDQTLRERVDPDYQRRASHPKAARQ